MNTQVTSIVTCMTDSERPFLRQAIDSVLNQSVPCDVRVYVAEDNAWIEELLSDRPDVVIRRVPLQPVGPIRNLGSSEADTEFVAFLDGDDFWLPRKIERQLAVVGKTGADLVGADHMLVREDGRVFAYGLCLYLPMPSSWLVRREIILGCPFPEEWPEDGLWWAASENLASKRRLPEFLIGYRVRNTSASSGEHNKQRKERFARASTNPGIALAILLGSWTLNRTQRSTRYRWHKTWKRGT